MENVIMIFENINLFEFNKEGLLEYIGHGTIEVFPS